MPPRPAREVIAITKDDVPLTAAEASALLGQVIAASGDMAGAMRAYQRAVFMLTSIGADRDAAQLWFELADLFEQVGDVTASRDAYRSAAAASGLRSRAKVANVASAEAARL